MPAHRTPVPDRAHHRAHPRGVGVPPAKPGGAPKGRGTVDAVLGAPEENRASNRKAARLPWWALALPVLAFVALLMLIASPGDAHAAGADPAVGDILRHILRSLVG